MFFRALEVGGTGGGSENGPSQLVGALRPAALRPMVRLFYSRSGSLCPLAASLIVLDLWPEPPSIRVGAERPKHLILRTLEGVGSKPEPRFQSNGRFLSQETRHSSGRGTSRSDPDNWVIEAVSFLSYEGSDPCSAHLTRLVLIGRSVSDASPPPVLLPAARPSPGTATA